MEQIKHFFPNLTSQQISQFEQLLDLYKDWNEKINVISRKDIDNLYHNHVLHSLSIAKYGKFNAGDNVLDAGTGGGFPGLPLAIMYPEVNFTLADSIGKKLKVIEAITNEIGLSNVNTIHTRLEDINQQFDFVVSRAVSRLDVMWDWVNKNIKTNHKRATQSGLIYLKGGDISNEVPNNLVIQKIDLNELFNEPVFEEKSLIHLVK